MAETILQGQTCLEKRGMTERHEEITRSDYNIENQYGPTHSDALSNGDAQGKGSGHQGHTHWAPDCTKPTTMIDYRNFDTSPESNIGGCLDINGYKGNAGRKEQMIRSLYDYQNFYGANLVDTSANQQDGQYVVKDRTREQVC